MPSLLVTSESYSPCTQARITLARAIYSKAEIILLDDVCNRIRDIIVLLRIGTDIVPGVGCPRRPYVTVDR